MTLRDYGYQTKKNDVLREKALTSAFREKGANWVNKQLRDMLRIARESESIILFKDKCNFIGISTEKEINRTMEDYEKVLNESDDRTEFLDNAVLQIGWRNVDIRLYDLWLVGKNSEKIKKDTDYVIEVHSHRKKIMQDIARRRLQEAIAHEEDSKDLDDDEDNEDNEYDEEQDNDGESISLRDYGYSVHKTERGRIGALQRAVTEEGIELVCERLEKLGKYHPVMLEDLETLKPSSVSEHSCECVSADEIRTIVREELSKVFGDIKKMNEDMQKMYSEMIV